MFKIIADGIKNETYALKLRLKNSEIALMTL